MKIRAFGYRRGVGKDTLANIVQRELRLKHRGLKVNVVGFADQLKQVCYSLYGWLGLESPRYYHEHPEDKDKEIMGLPCGWKTPRDIWIAVGNHVRALDKNVWINALLKTTTCDVLLISDLRFPKEIKAVREQNGLVCRIDRPQTEGADGQPDTVLMAIPDEQWDAVYVNDGDLHKLHRIAIQIASELAP